MTSDDNGGRPVAPSCNVDPLRSELIAAQHARRSGRLADAIRHFERAIRLNPRVAEIYNDVGQVWMQLGEQRKAEIALLEAVRLKPDLLEAHMNMATLYYQLGFRDSAIVSVRKAIGIRPDFAPAWHLLTSIKAFVREDDDVGTMEALFDRSVRDVDRLALAFGLGKAFEDLGRYDRAFEYWMVGNRLQRASSDYLLARDVREMATLKHLFDDAPPPVQANTKKGAETPVFVVGMPRSGTSLTEQILASHSQVWGAGELATVRRVCWNAVNRFPDDLAYLSRGAWRELGDAYLAELRAKSGGATVFTDKMPGNFLYLCMIRRMLPQARIIHCVRDPLDTGLSCFKQRFEAPALGFTNDLRDLGVYMRHYRALMLQWHRTWPGWIYDIAYEDLVADFAGNVAKLLEYCGLPFEEGCLRFHEADRAVRTASATQVRQPVHAGSVGRWKHYERELEPLKRVLDADDGNERTA